MPFKSKKQQGFMFANHPKIAKRMADDAKKKGEPVVEPGPSTTTRLVADALRKASKKRS